MALVSDRTTPAPAGSSYQELLAEGELLYPEVRIGRPGRSRSYWPLIAVLRLPRMAFRIEASGSQHVAKGPAILVGNHVRHFDPGAVVTTNWWRVSAFTKVELFDLKIAPFFRMMGQIPLRRGDDASTDWALRMAQDTLSRGGKIGIYPEGTRSPDRGTLHKLHKRMLIPLLRDNPDVPVHAVGIRYEQRRGLRRTRVTLRISAPLPLDRANMTADEIVGAIREAILPLSGQEYADVYAQEVKAALRRQREGSA